MFESPREIGIGLIIGKSLHFKRTIFHFIIKGFMTQKGAFNVAVKTGAPVVPITVIGTGNLMPARKEGILNSDSIQVVIHKPIIGKKPMNYVEMLEVSMKKHSFFMVSECTERVIQSWFRLKVYI